MVKGHRKVWHSQAHAYSSHDLLLATQKKAAPAPPMSTEVVKTRNESCAMWSFWQFRPQGRGMPSQLERTSYRCNFSPRKRRGNGGRYGIHASMLQSYEIAETEVFARTKCPKKRRKDENEAAKTYPKLRPPTHFGDGGVFSCDDSTIRALFCTTFSQLRLEHRQATVLRTLRSPHLSHIIFLQELESN